MDSLLFDREFYPVYHKYIMRRGTEVVITGSPGERLGGHKLPRGFESRPLRHKSNPNYKNNLQSKLMVVLDGELAVP